MGRGGDGGDDGSGTVNIPQCPYCEKRVIFYDYEQMVAHIATHEGVTRNGVPDPNSLRSELKRRI